MVAGAFWCGSGSGLVWPFGLPDQSTDLDQVVSEDSVAAPGSGAGEAGESCSVEPEVPFRAADPAFAAGSPADHLAERPSFLDLATGGAGSALAGHGDVADPGG